MAALHLTGGPKAIARWLGELREAGAPGCHMQALVENTRAVRFFERMSIRAHGVHRWSLAFDTTVGEGTSAAVQRHDNLGATARPVHRHASSMQSGPLTTRGSGPSHWTASPSDSMACTLESSLTAALAYGAADFIGGVGSRRHSSWQVVLVGQPAGALVMLATDLLLPGRPGHTGLRLGAAAGRCVTAET